MENGAHLFFFDAFNTLHMLTDKDPTADHFAFIKTN